MNTTVSADDVRRDTNGDDDTKNDEKLKVVCSTEDVINAITGEENNCEGDELNDDTLNVPVELTVTNTETSGANEEFKAMTTEETSVGNGVGVGTSEEESCKRDVT